MHEALSSRPRTSPKLHKVVYACNPSTREVESERPRVYGQDHPWLHEILSMKTIINQSINQSIIYLCDRKMVSELKSQFDHIKERLQPR